MKNSCLNPRRYIVSLCVVLGSFAIAEAATIDPVKTWNEQALTTVRQKNAIDAQAARLYAMVNVAMYDAVNGIQSRHDKKDDRAPALVDGSGAPSDGDIYAAAVSAAHAVLSGEYAADASLVSMYNAQKNSDLAALGNNPKVTKGAQWGANVGNQVRAARANDGATPTESPQPAGAGPGQFRSTFTNPQFRNLQPFGIANASVYYGAGPAPLTSFDYAAAFNFVRDVGKRPQPGFETPEDNAKKATYDFWALGSNSWQPPGEWIEIALAVLQSRPLDLPNATRLLALESMAMCDTVAPTYMTKYVFHHWRPTTAINEANTDGNPLTDQDTSWIGRGGIGGSPEYWSGHSTFSASAAEVLASFFCDDNISFTVGTDPASLGTRTYSSFSSAAAEAGISRVYGGLHFPFSNQDGLSAGKAVAREILNNKLLLLKGDTHFGQCPL